jgi:virginiamycin B lyase
LEGNKIARITTGGIFSEYAVPTSTSDPTGITAGPNGALWFTEQIGNQIASITTSGAITQYPVPTSASYPLRITPSPDGSLWFTEYFGNKIGQALLTTPRSRHF